MGRKSRWSPFRIAITVVILIVLGVCVTLHLRRGYWIESRWSDGSYEAGTTCLSSFHVREHLETKIIFQLDMKDGACHIRLYWVPEDDVNVKLVDGTEQERARLYEQGVRPGITDAMVKVYEESFSVSGTYEIDTVDMKPGFYMLEITADSEEDIREVTSFRYKHYNWMDVEQKIRIFFGGENDDRYSMP